MPLDPRSRERLEALGRTLPKPLPAPQPPAPPRAASPQAPRHAIEKEENPEQLFRELMAASPDGSVPPHLLDRLRQLEQSRSQPRQGPANASRSGAPSRAAATASRSPASASRSAADPELELYEAFEDLLRLSADDEAGPSRSATDRAAADRLKPRPAERPRRPEQR